MKRGKDLLKLSQQTNKQQHMLGCNLFLVVGTAVFRGKTSWCEKNLLSAVSCPTWLPWTELSQWEGTSQELAQVALVGARTQGHEPSSATFPVSKQGTGWELELPSLEATSLLDAVP